MIQEHLVRTRSVVAAAAMIKDRTWSEVGDRIMQGGKATRFFEMKLARLGDTTWPVAGTVTPK